MHDKTDCQLHELTISTARGAGMAGVSAGASLSNAGVTDFKLIEYQDRIGGRTLSVEFGARTQNSSWNVELGTNWVSF